MLPLVYAGRKQNIQHLCEESILILSKCAAPQSLTVWPRGVCALHESPNSIHCSECSSVKSAAIGLNKSLKS